MAVPAHIAELLTVLMRHCLLDRGDPGLADWQWGIGPDTDNAHYHNLNEVSTTGNVSPYLNGGSAKTTKTLIVTSQRQPPESGASWSHQDAGRRQLEMLDVFPIGQRSRTQNRTDLSRTKTKGRGEGASSQAGREKCLTHSRSFQQQAKYFSVWLRWKINLDFWKKSHMFWNVLVGWWWMTKGGGGARFGSSASAVTGRHAACHYPNGGSLVGHYTPIPHYATFTHLLYSRKPKKLTKKRISYRNIGYSSKV